tara:strand:+ start:64 stop:564 length:501 start_codon:yes stop_codon:yes gene_type:complete
MDDLPIYLDSLSLAEAFLRLVLALAFGYFIGYDRNKKHKPIDFRVYMIVAAATTLLAIMSLELLHIYEARHDDMSLDVMKMVQGVLTGIGFLGAGAIMKSENDNEIIGTATGASIWAAGAMGLMIGFGLYSLAILGFTSLLVILVVFGYFREDLFGNGDKSDTEQK